MTADAHDRETAAPPSEAPPVAEDAADAGAPPPAAAETYDVVLCGTDLTQSILASALSRAGRRVLHVDGDDWYGGLDAVLHAGSTLEAFVARCDERSAGGAMPGAAGAEERASEEEGDRASLRLLPRGGCGDVRIHSRTFLHPENDADATAEGVGAVPADPRPEDKKEEDEDEDAATGTAKPKEGASDATSAPPPTVAPLGRGFCFDLTPSLLYAAGDAVECLVKSGVSEYLEFKSLRGLYLLMEEETAAAARGGRRRRPGRGGGEARGAGAGGAGDGAGRKLTAHRVPCSKGDVFRSKLLSPIEKRRLMKFLQLITDYGMATQAQADDPPAAAEDATAGAASAAETPDPAPGAAGEEAIRSVNEHHLHRGRALSRPQNKAAPTSADMEALVRCVRDGASFADYLADVAKLPARLATVVLFSLALAPRGRALTAREGVEALGRHLTALGRFGDTAFLVPLHGSGELSQAFCRSGAVYGATYMLRRAPAALALEEDGRVRGVVLDGEEHIGERGAVDTGDVAARTVACAHAVVPRGMLGGAPAGAARRARIYRRVSILDGKLIHEAGNEDAKDGSDAEQRYAIVVPPGTPGLGNRAAIHGVAVDESACVAPRGCTVLHLTTSSLEDDETPDAAFVEALEKAVEFLVASQPTRTEAARTRAVERHHVAFSYAVATPGPADPAPPRGLHVCEREGQALTCEAAFGEARRIFRDICPDADFLAVAPQVEDAIAYREADDSDDEERVLESACTMMRAPAAEAPASEGTTETVA